MSHKVEVTADASGAWYTNAIRLATREEAEGYGQDLAWRWTAVRDWRVAESEDPVNYRWNGMALEPIIPEGGA